MDRLKHMKECLVSCVENQISGNLHQVDTHELGAAVDMIKDLSEAIYYCTITEAMEEKEEMMERMPQQYNSSGQSYKAYDSDYPKVIEPMYNNQMYASGNGRGNSGGRSVSSGGNGRSYFHDMPMMERDHREGQSPMYRKMYMEAKEQGNNSKQMQELEAYMQELSNDILGMVNDASAEEKQVMRQKITTLASKIK